MKAFSCRVCGNSLYFENSICITCHTRLGFSRAEHAIVPVDDQGQYADADGRTWYVCRNLKLSGCTWLTDQPGDSCFACGLTRTRPNDEDVEALKEYKVAEGAKRRLVVELDTLGFPIVPRTEDPVNGLAFDLLSSAKEKVTIGHASGIITLDLAESDDAHREKVRVQLDEPYRTMLGHFRHEIGHYIEWQHVRGDLIEQARELFGNEEESYADAIERHYSEGPPAGWEGNYISMYATMHPFEDFAETFAHYMHICDTIETASAHGLTTVASPQSFTSFRDLVVGVWIPLSVALNQINRSMGKGPLYPFVIPAPVLDKLQFVADLPRR
ncbi:zinc-binding metallopeptidase family protein [Aeromicrobium wangtongii]|uniref:zinc-binding metallopeptidase family protein n=1 Tax=Aeromicrobium wangtongii TaxID=2969247 RepID=UPI002017C4B7|nr:putative zinc-binding metallopeptidase [Aeromicrobium wangtongii]MCL3818844.1 putative zinc-binding peptidase [Aeromicrobium wangtongii]